MVLMAWQGKMAQQEQVEPKVHKAQLDKMVSTENRVLLAQMANRAQQVLKAQLVILVLED
jgi:hypothetical protein